jgi:hypothetical protein
MRSLIFEREEILFTLSISPLNPVTRYMKFVADDAFNKVGNAPAYDFIPTGSNGYDILLCLNPILKSAFSVELVSH